MFHVHVSGDLENQSAKLPADQLDSLVVPIALYPHPMLNQALMASTYRLETIQLQQWLNQNKKLKDKALAEAVQKQSWDPSLQALAAMPDLVKLLADNINTDPGAMLSSPNRTTSCPPFNACARLLKTRGTLRPMSSRRWKPRRSKTSKVIV